MASLDFAGVRVALIALSMLLGASLALASGESESYRFKVYLDGDPIGYHHFDVRQEGGRKVVENSARFDVRLLFLTVYSYAHDNTEVWTDNCLARIDARTDDNGESFFVRGSRSDGSFQVATQDGSAALPGCVKTFSYWNSDFLNEARLLNSQTGEYLPVNVSAEDRERVSVNGQLVECNRYRLTARDVDITLWYVAATGQWAALESKTPQGHVVRYEKVSPLRPIQAAASENKAFEL